MAKRREMIEQLAQRRKDRVPTNIARYLKTLTVRFVEVMDVRRKKVDGSDGSVEKVVSALEMAAVIRGVSGPITCKVKVDVKPNYTVAEEMEKSVKWGLCAGIDAISKEYARRIAARKAMEDGPLVPEVVPEPKADVEVDAVQDTGTQPESEPGQVDMSDYEKALAEAETEAKSKTKTKAKATEDANAD